MGLYRLLVSQHIAADPDWEPTREDKMLAERTGRAPRAPSRTYKAGELVESKTDLVAKFGHEKFAEVHKGGKKGRKDQAPPDPDDTGEIDKRDERVGFVPDATAIAPGGQVSQGHQLTSGTKTGHAFTGLDSPEAREESKSAREERGDEEGESYPGPEEGGGAGEGGRPSLESLTVAELREHASDNEIDLKGATVKSDIIKAIKHHHSKK